MNNNHICLYKLFITIMLTALYYIFFFMNLNGSIFEGKCCCFIGILALYIVVVLAYKFLSAIHFLTFCKKYRTTPGCGFIKNLWCLPFMILSPDFVLTKIVKSSFNIDIFRKENLIKMYNFINLIVSAIFFIILIFINGCAYFYMLVLIRFVSRLIEIVISFVFDVLSSDKSSSLKTNNRMVLAVISFIEYYLLIISIFAINQGKTIDLTLLNSFFGNLFNIFSCNCCCCHKDSLKDILPIAVTIIFNAIMFTFVICNYVNNKKDNKLYLIYDHKAKKVVSIKLNCSLKDLRTVLEDDLKIKLKPWPFLYIFKYDRDIFGCEKVLRDKPLLPIFLVMYQNKTVRYVYSLSSTSTFDFGDIKNIIESTKTNK